MKKNGDLEAISIDNISHSPETLHHQASAVIPTASLSPSHILSEDDDELR